jgi:branched-chain amino acid transport system permease protein
MSVWHAGFWTSLLLSGIVAALFATVIGIPLLRLRGHYFAIATLGVAEGMREVVTNLPGLTGGGAGVTVPTVGGDATTPYLGNDGFYLLFLALAALSVLVGGLVSRSKFGYGLRAIHQDEDAAAAMGINTTRLKVAAFALSGFIIGLVGSSYAFQQVTIFPARLFDVDITVLMVVMVVIGGSGTVLGPLLGAVALQFLSEYLRQHFTNLHTFILAGIIMLAVLLLPQGAVNYVREARRTGQYSLLSNIRRYRL